VAGSLSLEANTAVPFNDITIGSPANSKSNLAVVNVRDYRGSTGSWTATGSENGLWIVTAGVNNISNASFAWNPTTASLTSPDSSSLTGVAKDLKSF